ncbi:transmembrane protein 141 [Drosophila ficusphila]|uniref:transmembrane protein 141 n=1 Tax=Drosophila ficusphila TaxID=30025 RepID=UPI0007E6AE16|nr:transmembrane protein 141 [Drosophila ficusphila]
MNDIKRLKDQQREKHPGFDGYIDCMTRSLFTGLATFCLSFSGTYFAQKIIQSRIRYPAKFNILIASLVATGVSYQTTSSRTKSCQAAWMAFEEKHSVLHEESY